MMQRKIVFQRFYLSESYENVADLTIRYLKVHGKPVSIYTDRGSAYKVNNHNQEGEHITQYQKALNELDSNLIHARSPQAKVRVERSFRTDQDRLVKELRLRNITTIEQANQFLDADYNAQHNKKFARKPKNRDNLHIPLKLNDLSTIFSKRSERTVANDWTVRYCNRILQINIQRELITNMNVQAQPAYSCLLNR